MKKAVASQEKKPSRRELLEQWKEAKSSTATPKKFVAAAPKPARFEDLLRTEDRRYAQADPTFRFRLGKISMSKSVMSSVKKLSTSKFDWFDYTEIPVLSSRLERAFGGDLRLPQFTAEAKMEECETKSVKCSQEVSFPRAMKVDMSRLAQIENEMTDAQLEADWQTDEQIEEMNQNKENKAKEKKFAMKMKEEKPNVMKKSESKESKGKQKFESKKITPVQQVASKPPSLSKKRKERDFGDQKENVGMMGKQSLKKVLLNDNSAKSSLSKSEQVKIHFEVIKSATKKDFQEPWGKESPMIAHGSGLKNATQDRLKGSAVVEKMLTPVRSLSGLAPKTPVPAVPMMSKEKEKIVSENEDIKYSKPSVRFSDQNEVSHVEKDMEEMFKPLDMITQRLREMSQLINRRPTPYSKPTDKLEEEEEAGNENENQVRGLESTERKIRRIIPMTDLGTEGFSSKKKGLKEILTPFKDLTNEHGDGLAPVFDSLSKNVDGNVELVRSSSDVTKRLDSFY